MHDEHGTNRTGRTSDTGAAVGGGVGWCYSVLWDSIIMLALTVTHKRHPAVQRTSRQHKEHVEANTSGRYQP